MGEMDEIVREFVVESMDALESMERDLLALEKEPTSPELLARIFRSIHTIKGTSGVLGFHRIEAVAHAGENVLSRMRDGRLLLRQEIATALLAMSDVLRTFLAEVDQCGEEKEADTSVVIAALNVLLQDPAENSIADAPKPLLGRLLVSESAVPEEAIKAALEQQQTGDTRKLGQILVQNGSAQAKEVMKAIHAQAESAGAAAAATSNSIRVDVGLLDKVMNLVGELVLARNRILQFTGTQNDAAFVTTAQLVNLITTELQEGVMKMRMQPIGNVWNKFPRIVRDLALGSGKQVRLELEGTETELDKTILEAIKDPLTHLVRNAVDHGVEKPDARVAAGKNAEGRLRLSAFHEGGQVNIEISDDGAGLNLARIREKAVARGAITADQAARMTDREVANLIFLPGLSTAEKVTNVSGRGVGMDVVKTNVEKIGGAVDVHSVTGEGTSFKIKIPLTLAIIPALIVTSSGERFAIPQVSLLELVRLDTEQTTNAVETIQGAPVYRLRGRLLPLVYLNRELHLDNANVPLKVSNLVVLQADGTQFGLVVDEISDTEEIVVKPLGQQLKAIPHFAGATIMGDGRVALILDVLGLAQKANVLAETKQQTMTVTETSAASALGQRAQWLVFRTGMDGQMAVPLSLVSRLEEVNCATVERAGNSEVVQYRGQIMPLVRVSDVMGTGEGAQDGDALQVIVYSERGHCVGLVVGQILDVVEQQVTFERKQERRGLLGSAVIMKKITDVLNVPELVAAAGVAMDDANVMSQGRA
jgi:two-component system, chemotaxis family, sensor kinase CheA